MVSIGPSPPPARDEVEVSLFGPGFGECLVIHLGEDDWVIVDSCRDLDSKVPVALKYLEGLGVDVSTRVRLVVATHWHDDHIDGLAETFVKARGAAFVCTNAFRREEFFGLLLNYFALSASPGGSGMKELHDLIEEVKRRQGAGSALSFLLASANTVLWQRFGTQPSSVMALSPSAHDVLAGLARIDSEELFKVGGVRRRLPALDPNDVSVVLSARVGDVLVLLGADLEEFADSRRGWRAVVALWNPAAGFHEYFKVPHHGSSNAHYGPVWSQMLAPHPEATITPFRHMLPTDTDLIRIKGLAGRVSLTSPRRVGRYRSPNPAVQRVLGGMTRKVWKYPPDFGHIRYRRNVAAGSAWNCELFGAAAFI